MITIATAECFTHGQVGREIHAFSRGYPAGRAWRLDPKKHCLSLVAALFIPTIAGVRSVLRFEPPPPVETLDGIKVYDQQGDGETALMMAGAVREITGADIGIGTTAGIGMGGIALVDDETALLATSGVYADLRSSDPASIMERQAAGIQTALSMLEGMVLGETPSLPEGAALTIRRLP